MKLKNIEKLNLKSKTVLLRVDFDVSIKNGGVVDGARIISHLPTINFLLKQKAKVILISHLGRPQGMIDEKYSLKPVFYYLKKKIKNLEFFNNNFDNALKEKIKDKPIVLLENLRFNPGEEKNDKKFAKFLASLANLYINDAFAVSHRKHASVSAVTQYLPSYAGLLLEKEIKNLTEVIIKPYHPFIVLMGGAKISTKMPVLKTLARKADQILVGGALANDLFKAEGYNIGQSFSESHDVEINKTIKRKIVLPKDVVIKTEDKIQNIKVDSLSRYKDFKILDIGKQTIQLFAKYLENAKIIIWNGPMGLFEEKPFDQGTRGVVKIIARNKKAKIIIGGGDTITCFKQKSLKPNVFISTGGGAMLEFLSGKMLPGIKPLLKNK